MATIRNTLTALSLAAAIYVPPLQSLLPQPGEGPDRQTMEDGYMTLYGRGVVKVLQDNNGSEKQVTLESKFHFNKDIAYLYTADLLAETGMVMLEKINSNQDKGGVLTPASALGSDLTQRILSTMDVTFELAETQSDS